MKRFFVFLILMITVLVPVFSKELSGTDLSALHLALDSRLYVYDFEELADQLAYMNKIENQLKEMESELSAEADLICRTVIQIQKQSLISADEYKKEQEQGQKKKNKKDSEAEAIAMNNFNIFTEFEETHKDLSSYFYFHFNEVKMATLPYLSTGKQLEFLKGILDSYRSVEAINPNNSENLFTLATILYSMPKVAGGNKEEGIELTQKAIKTAQCNYEKASALILYSQLLFEDKKIDEAKKYFDQGLALDPQNINMLRYQKMNKAGYSMFQEREYSKKEEKN